MPFVNLKELEISKGMAGKDAVTGKGLASVLTMLRELFEAVKPEKVLKAFNAAIGAIRIINANSPSLESTAHAVQIGPTDGRNLRVGIFDVMSVLNGAAAVLHLNRLGGDVQINSGAGGGRAWHVGNLPITRTSSYTPTLTNGTVGNGTLNFRYAQSGSLVVVTGIFTLGTTSAITGDLQFGMPPGISAVGDAFGVARFNDADGSTYMGTAQVFNGGNIIYARAQEASATYLRLANLSAATPFTWTSGDLIRLHVVFTVA